MPDRILKTNGRGEVRYDNNNQPKVAIDNIERGILQDGQNFRTQDNVIEVGGEGQPTVAGVETFALKLSDYVGSEIGGTYFSNVGSEMTTHIAIGSYVNNSYKRTQDHGADALRGFVSSMAEFNSYKATGLFHTHPSGGISDSDRLVPSDQDLDFRDRMLIINPALQFFLLTKPVNYGDPYPNKIPYTTGGQRRLR